jgi:hypothetical protein
MTYKEVKEFFESLKILKDTGWNVRPCSLRQQLLPNHTCIADCIREIEFDHELTPTELRQVCEYLDQEASAGDASFFPVFPVALSDTDGNLYRFYTKQKKQKS